MVDGSSHRFGVSGFTEFDESCPFMQDIPDDLADTVSDGPDCLDISQTDHEALEKRRQMAILGSDGGLCRLVQQASQEAIAFGGVAGMVLPGALIGAGADTDPGCQSVDQLNPVQMRGQQAAVDVSHRAGQRIDQRRQPALEVSDRRAQPAPPGLPHRRPWRAGYAARWPPTDR